MALDQIKYLAQLKNALRENKITMNELHGALNKNEKAMQKVASTTGRTEKELRDLADGVKGNRALWQAFSKDLRDTRNSFEKISSTMASVGKGMVSIGGAMQTPKLALKALNSGFSETRKAVFDFTNTTRIASRAIVAGSAHYKTASQATQAYKKSLDNVTKSTLLSREEANKLLASVTQSYKGMKDPAALKNIEDMVIAVGKLGLSFEEAQKHAGVMLDMMSKYAEYSEGLSSSAGRGAFLVDIFRGKISPEQAQSMMMTERAKRGGGDTEEDALAQRLKRMSKGYEDAMLSVQQGEVGSGAFKGFETMLNASTREVEKFGKTLGRISAIGENLKLGGAGMAGLGSMGLSAVGGAAQIKAYFQMKKMSQMMTAMGGGGTALGDLAGMGESVGGLLGGKGALGALGGGKTARRLKALQRARRMGKIGRAGMAARGAGALGAAAAPAAGIAAAGLVGYGVGTAIEKKYGIGAKIGENIEYKHFGGAEKEQRIGMGTQINEASKNLRKLRDSGARSAEEVKMLAKEMGRFKAEAESTGRISPKLAQLMEEINQAASKVSYKKPVDEMAELERIASEHFETIRKTNRSIELASERMSAYGQAASVSLEFFGDAEGAARNYAEQLKNATQAYEAQKTLLKQNEQALAVALDLQSKGVDNQKEINELQSQLEAGRASLTEHQRKIEQSRIDMEMAGHKRAMTMQKTQLSTATKLRDLHTEMRLGMGVSVEDQANVIRQYQDQTVLLKNQVKSLRDMAEQAAQQAASTDDEAEKRRLTARSIELQRQAQEKYNESLDSERQTLKESLGFRESYLKAFRAQSIGMGAFSKLTPTQQFGAQYMAPAAKLGRRFDTRAQAQGLAPQTAMTYGLGGNLGVNITGGLAGLPMQQQQQYLSAVSPYTPTEATVALSQQRTLFQSGGAPNLAAGAAGASRVRLRGGGSVPGRGSSDTVPAMLTPGEYVVPKRDARAMATIHQAYSSGSIRGYQSGGMVAPVSGMFGGAGGGGGGLHNVKLVIEVRGSGGSDTQTVMLDALRPKSGTSPLMFNIGSFGTG